MNWKSILTKIPLLAIVLLTYLGVVVFAEVPRDQLATGLFTVTLISGADFTMSWGDLLIAMGVFLLYLEIVKSTRTGNASIVDHMLSTVVFIVYLIMFLMVKSAGTGTFLLLTLMSLTDVVAGFTVTIATARRDFGIGAHSGGPDIGG